MNLLLSLFLLAGSGDQDPEIRLSSRVTATRLHLSGRTRLPDGAEISIALSHQVEVFDTGRATLEHRPSGQAPASRRRSVKGRRFSAEFRDRKPGAYLVTLRFTPDLQPPGIRKACLAFSPVKETRILLIGGARALLRGVTRDLGRIAEALDQASSVLEAGRDRRAVQKALGEWFQKHRLPLAELSLPAAANALKSRVRSSAVWGMGVADGKNLTPKDSAASLAAYVNSILLRERTLWDVKILRSLLSHEKPERGEFEIVNARIGESRIKALNSFQKELGTTFADLAARTAELLNDLPAESEKRETKLTECRKAWTEMETLIRKGNKE